MITSEKIEEWIKEVEQRPVSAALIIQYIAGRLRDLTNRNEELLAENIALISGKRVEEYEQRIAHLEYEMDLLKRRFGGDLSSAVSQAGISAAGGKLEGLPGPEPLQALLYDIRGRVLRLAVNLDALVDGGEIGYITGNLSPGGEAPRLIVAPAMEELMFVFSSGRVAALPATSIPLSADSAAALDWEQTAVPDEPRAGESLACLAPVSQMALAEYFVQVSRRGYIKKIKAAMAQSILSNHYIGSAAKIPVDKTFSTLLCGKDDRLVLVSWEGYLLCVEVKDLPFSSEEVLRLGNTDHLVQAFPFPAAASSECSLLFVTQGGKVIYWTGDRLEIANSFRSKGQALYSQQRREKGARVVGAAAVAEQDWVAALHQDGRITLHSVGQLFASGVLPTQTELLAFSAFPIPAVSGGA